jgi:hypothetical protein
MHEATISGYPRNFLESFASRLPKFLTEIQGTRNMSAVNGDRSLEAVRAREYSAEAPDGIEVWKYSFPLPANDPVEDVHVRFRSQDTGALWTGVFECARGRHVDVVPWTQADAIVVVAANAIYIVDPRFPEKFNGVAAPVEITGITFDETGRHMFVAESLRVYAFSSDGRFRWISEPFDGYGARFRGCGGRVLAVEINPAEPDPDGEPVEPSLIRLRTEDGTILRSRFRLAHRYRFRPAA